MTYIEQIQVAYACLGLEFDATEAQVNKAYKDITKRFHPDLHMNDTPENIKKYEELQKEANYAHEILENYFKLQEAKKEVAPEEEAKAIKLMYNGIFKQEIDKTKFFINQAQNSLNNIFTNFSQQAINNTEPLFDDVKKLVTEQKEILNKCSAFASPPLINIQTKNIQQLDEYITNFDIFLKFSNENLPKIIASINDIAKIPLENEATLQVISNTFGLELKALADSVKTNGPASIKDKNVGPFLDAYMLFFDSKIHNILPKKIHYDINKNFDKEAYRFMKLIDLINEKLPFNRSFSDNKKVGYFDDAIDYLSENIDAYVKESLLKDHDADSQYLNAHYRIEFVKILNNVAKQHELSHEILYYSNFKFAKLQADVPFFFRLAKTYNQYYFLNGFNLEPNKNTLEALESIKNYTEKTLEQYTTSLLDNHADEKSPIQDPGKFAESIHNFITNFALNDNATNKEYGNIGIDLMNLAKLNPVILDFINKSTDSNIQPTPQPATTSTPAPAIILQR